MAKRRKKKRTHAEGPGDAAAKIPKSFVIRSGAVGKSVQLLVKDVRRIMEPNTAAKLKERKGNKLKDFVHIAGQLHVSHMLIFSSTEAGVNFRIGRIPRGPTLNFKVLSYVLSKDIRALQNRPKSPGSDFKVSPLVVLNNFNDDAKQIKLMATVFQNLFPPINVKTMKLTEARRVVLLHRDPEADTIELRHYSIDVKAVGVSKSVKSIIQADIPDLNRFDEISDYVLRGAFASESDVEDGPESSVVLPQKYVGRGNKKAEQRAIKLTELGPRLHIQLTKISVGLCDGEVIYHRHVTKTREEAQEIKTRVEKRENEKAKRKAEQEANVRRKRAKTERTDEDDDEEADDEADESEDGGHDEDMGSEDEDAHDDDEEEDEEEGDSEGDDDEDLRRMNSQGLLHEAESLYENGLQASAEIVLGLLVSTLNTEPPSLNPQNFELLSHSHRLLGKCYLTSKQYWRAITQFKKALAYLKEDTSDLKRGKHSAAKQQTIIGIKEELGTTYMAAETYELAQDILGSIPENLQTVEVLRKLAFIYQESGRKKYLTEAIMGFKTLETSFKNSTLLLSRIAECCFQNGNEIGAIGVFNKIRRLDPEAVETMDTFAEALKEQRKVSELRLLSEDLMRVASEHPEPWLAHSYYWELKDDNERALFFADKAISIKKSHAACYRTKGRILLKLGHYGDSALSFRQSHRFSKNLGTFRGLMESYIGMGRPKEALEVAREEAAECMPENPRALTLIGIVLSHLPDQKLNASIALDRALEKDPHCADAVLALVSLLNGEQKWKESIHM
ncbi:hypothetical protein HDU67_005436 [Dinochytrium kinnereticum]|nr:hypothetical protein HDU67_005436 [Dinochytrium kinnereticum]